VQPDVRIGGSEFYTFRSPDPGFDNIALPLPFNADESVRRGDAAFGRGEAARTGIEDCVTETCAAGADAEHVAGEQPVDAGTAGVGVRLAAGC